MGMFDQVAWESVSNAIRRLAGYVASDGVEDRVDFR
jgi:hypothetical protein